MEEFERNLERTKREHSEEQCEHTPLLDTNLVVCFSIVESRSFVLLVSSSDVHPTS